MKQTITVYSLIITLTALFIYTVVHTAPKALDRQYDNQATMVTLHKLSIK